MKTNTKLDREDEKNPWGVLIPQGSLSLFTVKGFSNEKKLTVYSKNTNCFPIYIPARTKQMSIKLSNSKSVAMTQEIRRSDQKMQIEKMHVPKRYVIPKKGTVPKKECQKGMFLDEN